MPKFANIRTDLEGPFAATTWTDRSIATYPQNYQGQVTATEFVRVNIINGAASSLFEGASMNGQLRVDIYVQSGDGMSRVYAIADFLDSSVSSQVFTNGTQTGASTLTEVGIDPDNPGLFRASYSVPFRHYS